MDKYLYEAARYALIVCRNSSNRYLCVRENMNKGWWIPGGKVRNDQLFITAAVRECQEEASITPVIKGIIRLDHGKYYDRNTFRCVYYAEPLDENQIPKMQADSESMQAKFLTLDEIVSLKPQWRAPQIYLFPKYLQEGGVISPLSIFKENHHDQYREYMK